MEVNSNSSQVQNNNGSSNIDNDTNMVSGEAVSSLGDKVSRLRQEIKPSPAETLLIEHQKEEAAKEQMVKSLEGQLGMKAPSFPSKDQQISWLADQLKQKSIEDQIRILNTVKEELRVDEDLLNKLMETLNSQVMDSNNQELQKTKKLDLESKINLIATDFGQEAALIEMGDSKNLLSEILDPSSQSNGDKDDDEEEFVFL